MQGFNMGRYVPPDVEGTTSGNKLHGKHPLGSRASKPGALTVRFEMPFAVWCGTCPRPTIIGQGVRFNAEKRRVGSYYSTPIFSFRMRHADCGGAIEIHTDPKNTEYIVVEGGKRREDRGAGDDGDQQGAAVPAILTDKEREALRANAFAKLEKTIEDREQLVIAKARIGEIEAANRKTWEDPYELNRKLRREFRQGRHQREKDGKETEDLQDRMSLGIDLLPATAEDARRAALVDFGPVGSEGPAVGEKALLKPLFDSGLAPKHSLSNNTPSGGKRKLKSEVAASQMRESIVSEIVGNTRLVHDPFLVHDGTTATPRGPPRILGIKRRRVGGEKQEEASDAELEQQKIAHDVQKGVIQDAPNASKALVSYDSDSADST
ncbi:CWC16 protein [Xylariales sp. PMI_506]|nr:CWC16 protein [Xylariales sp. PMI_506]